MNGYKIIATSLLHNLRPDFQTLLAVNLGHAVSISCTRSFRATAKQTLIISTSKILMHAENVCILKAEALWCFKDTTTGHYLSTYLNIYIYIYIYIYIILKIYKLQQIFRPRIISDTSTSEKLYNGEIKMYFTWRWWGSNPRRLRLLRLAIQRQLSYPLGHYAP